VEWSEIAEIAEDLFRTWGGGDLRWAEAAWQVLSESGLTRYVFEVDRTVCIMRLVALNAFYREFCVRAFKEATSGDWQYEIFGLIVDYPLIDAFSLGQVAEQRDVFVNNSPHKRPDPRADAIRELVTGAYQQVVDAVQARWGKSGLFAALYVSPKAKGDLYPLNADLRDQVFTIEPPINMARAWEWYEDGAGL
jgi:hypothetical protein